MGAKKRYVLTEACEVLGMHQDFLVRCIRLHWVRPAAPELAELDAQDLARLRLIRELQEDFGVNDEGVPIILHLLDQLYSLRREVRARGAWGRGGGLREAVRDEGD